MSTETKVTPSYVQQVMMDLDIPVSVQNQASTEALNAYFHVVLTSDGLSTEQHEAARLAFIQFKGKSRALVVTKQHLENLKSRGLGLAIGEDDVLIECDGDDEAEAMVHKLIKEETYAMVGRVKSQEP